MTKRAGIKKPVLADGETGSIVELYLKQYFIGLVITRPAKLFLLSRSYYQGNPTFRQNVESSGFRYKFDIETGDGDLPHIDDCIPPKDKAYTRVVGTTAHGYFFGKESKMHYILNLRLPGF
jgi:hypothetical protein